MCFTGDQYPPLPPRSSDVGSHGPTHLTAADGTVLAAYEAVPATPRGASLVLLPDIRGLHPYYTDLAVACATAGLDTVAIDPYARTAKTDDRSEQFDFAAHSKALTHQQVAVDAEAAAQRLRSRSAAPVFTLGFCKFGGESWRLAASATGFAGCIGFYGKPEAAQDAIGQMRSPVLVLAAGADRSTTPEQNAAFAQAMSAAEVEHRMVTYEGAPHSFFDRGFAEWEDACADAWRQILGFIDEHI
jgi:carboxymethylenebutenolidase